MNAGVGPGVVSSVRNAAYGGSLFPNGSLPFLHCADDSAALAVLERRYARYTNYLREAVEGASFVELQHAVERCAMRAS